MNRLTLVLLLGVALPAPAAADTYIFEVSMVGEESVPPVVTSMSGSAVMTYDNETRRFDLTAEFSGLTIFTFMEDGFHLHRGKPGEIGAVLVGLPLYGEMITEPDGSITGYEGESIPLPEQTQLDDVDPEEMLINGNTYMMVHTGTNPNGEIRGQVLLKEIVPLQDATWSEIKKTFTPSP